MKGAGISAVRHSTGVQAPSAVHIAATNPNRAARLFQFSNIANPAKKIEIIDNNTRSGEKVGVTGTPAYFVNGRRLSGALPYEEFKKVIDSELAKK